MQMLPRYVQLRVSSSGDTSYRFNPPQMLVDEGVVEREELGTDTKEVLKLAKELNKQIDDWREEQANCRFKAKRGVTDLMYYQSNDFNMLRD